MVATSKVGLRRRHQSFPTSPERRYLHRLCTILVHLENGQKWCAFVHDHRQVSTVANREAVPWTCSASGRQAAPTAVLDTTRSPADRRAPGWTPPPTRRHPHSDPPSTRMTSSWRHRRRRSPGSCDVELTFCPATTTSTSGAAAGPHTHEHTPTLSSLDAAHTKPGGYDRGRADNRSHFVTDDPSDPSVNWPTWPMWPMTHTYEFDYCLSSAHLLHQQPTRSYTQLNVTELITVKQSRFTGLMPKVLFLKHDWLNHRLTDHGSVGHDPFDPSIFTDLFYPWPITRWSALDRAKGPRPPTRQGTGPLFCRTTILKARVAVMTKVSRVRFRVRVSGSRVNSGPKPTPKSLFSSALPNRKLQLYYKTNIQ